MKGIVFTEFLEMVEDKFSYELVDQLLTENKLESGGIYTTVGTYNYSEMVQLVVDLSDRTGIETSILLNEYGKYFFQVLQSSYPQFFESISDPFHFLESIENHIHVEVKKLYPDAELPSFETHLISKTTLKMIYISERKMSDFAEGLIFKTLEYFKTPCDISKKNMEEDGTVVQFLIQKL